jgi:hypothetical protein
VSTLPLCVLLRRWTDWAGLLRSRHRRVSGGSAAQRDFALQRRPAAGGRLHRSIRLEPHIRLALRSYATRDVSRRLPSTVLRREFVLASPGMSERGPSTTAGGTPARHAPSRPSPTSVVHQLCRETFRRLIDDRRRQVEFSYGGTAAMNAAAPDRIAARHRAAAAPDRTPSRLSSYGPRPELVLRRPPSGEGPAARQNASRIDGDHAAPEHTSSVPPIAAPVDISQLTDEVVRQIDRRIVAHRERLGQI